MRVTNSMLVNNFMRDLNTNMNKLDKLQSQLASGRKFAHISDDPIALIYSQAARNRLARLSHYQRTVGSAQDWLRQVESGVMELQGRVADIYESVIDVATDVKGASDKNNIAQLVAQLRDHYIDTLNATFGDKYMFAGYNTPGDDAATKTIKGPFTLDENWNLHYNGHNLSDMLQLEVVGEGGAIYSINSTDIKGIFGGLKIDITGDVSDVITSVNDTIAKVNDLIPDIARVNVEIKDKTDEIGVIAVQITTSENIIAGIDDDIMEQYSSLERLNELNALKDIELEKLRGLKLQDSQLNKELSEIYERRDAFLADLGNLANIDTDYDPSGRVSLTLGIVKLIGFDADPDATPVGPPDPNYIPTIQAVAGSISEMTDILDMLKKLQGDVLTFDVGPGVSMEVTFNGIDLVMFQAPDNTTLNIFNLLHEVYIESSTGAPATELGKFITPLQYAQNHLLAKTAELGGRTKRLDLLAARYTQDELNYEMMKSDAEDADMADVIMYQKMAEAVYQAALSAGARIIQPTLMDFLR